MNTPTDERLARQVAQVTGTFEHVLLGRSPTSVGVVADADWMVVHVHEPLSAVERRLAADAEGAVRVRDFHRYLFESSVDSLLRHVQNATGVHFRGAIAHVDLATGSVLKTLSTRAEIDLFLLGQGLPVLGVPVNAHLHAYGSTVAVGNGAARGRVPEGSANH